MMAHVPGVSSISALGIKLRGRGRGVVTQSTVPRRSIQASPRRRACDEQPTATEVAAGLPVKPAFRYTGKTDAQLLVE